MAPFGRSVSPLSIISSYAAYSASDRALPPGVAVPSIRGIKPRFVFSHKGDSPFGCSRATSPFERSESPSITSFESLYLSNIRWGSPSRCSRAAAPFSRSMSPLSVICWSYTVYSAADRILLPGAAEPRLPSEATRIPPQIVSNHLAYSALNGAPPPSAAEPWLPSGTVWALHPSFELRCVLSGGRGSPSQCSRAAAPFGHNGGSLPHTSLQGGLSLPVQQCSSAAEPQLPSDAE
ncbi:hypothetical protein ROHU_031850 [Labeo rohita]|uniref:Uncharacterized protein n=1 Tax=Labeo rohita TaxID=84645 RepID=A0A498L6Q6_LABRO|nr:hypothetical protein ROHU_034977 [Labeo rohita]RXN08428.1 hypothetical protein ROHU_031850 [Labeo rohita]